MNVARYVSLLSLKHFNMEQRNLSCHDNSRPDTAKSYAIIPYCLTKCTWPASTSTQRYYGYTKVNLTFLGEISEVLGVKCVGNGGGGPHS